MKELLFNSGGQPLRLNDLEYLQQNVKDMTASLANSFGNGPFRLFGVNISVTDSGGIAPLLNISFGAIYYNYDIYAVDQVTNQALASGTTLNDILTTRYFDLVVIDSDSRTFLDSFSHNVLRDNKAVLTTSATTWGTNVPATIGLAFDKATDTDVTEGTDDYKFITSLKLKNRTDIIDSDISDINDIIENKPWFIVGNDSGATTYNANFAAVPGTGYRDLSYSKDGFGNLFLSGKFRNVSGGTLSAGSYSVTTLPVGYRPSYVSFQPVVDDNLKTHHTILVNTSGQVILYALSNISDTVDIYAEIAFRK